VGANLGFYTLLFARRGYDVIAVEPAVQTISRLLFSLNGNAVRVGRDGRDGWGTGQGAARDVVVYPLANAAGDAFASKALRFISDNPGATWVDLNTEARGDEATVTGEERGMGYGSALHHPLPPPPAPPPLV